MIFIIAGVFLVLIVMNLFLFIVIRQMSRATGRQIEKDAMRLCAVYDKLLEEKSNALKGIEQEYLEAQEQKKAAFSLWKTDGGHGEEFTGHFPFPVPGHYRDSRFRASYQRIGETFRCSVQDVLSCIKKLDLAASEEYGRMARILDVFSFDQVCRVIALDETAQRKFISEALEPECRRIYDWYTGETGQFEVSGFLDFVRNESRFLDHCVMVYTGNRSLYEDLLKQKISGMEVQYDENICEGFKLVQGNRMYDYSI